jgi:hypothetical protein
MMSFNGNIVNLEGNKIYPASQMHLLARRLDRMLAKSTSELLCPIRASLYLIVRDWAIENKILYSPFNKIHPFVGDSFSLITSIEHGNSIVERSYEFFSSKMGGSLLKSWRNNSAFGEWPFQTLYEYFFREERHLYLCRQPLLSSTPSHLKLFLKHDEIVVTGCRQFSSSDVKNADNSATYYSPILQDLARHLDMHMQLPEIRMILEETSSKINLTAVAKLYVPMLIAGYVQSMTLSNYRPINFTIDCISDPSSIGVMFGSLLSRSKVSELVHGSFIDHTSVISRRLSKACILPSTFICLESISPKIANHRSHYAGVAGRWVCINSSQSIEKEVDIYEGARNALSLNKLPMHSEILIVDATSAEQDEDELSQLEEDLTRVIGILLKHTFCISVKAHPRLGIGAPMTNALNKYPMSKIRTVNNSSALCEIKESFSAFILNYETNSWKELIFSSAPVYILSARSLLDLELLRFGAVELFWTSGLRA